MRHIGGRHALLGAIIAALARAIASTASADPSYEAMNAPEGVYWRSEPNWAAAERITGFGVYNGTVLEVHCYQNGTAVEGSADTMWEQATDVAGSGYGSGWLNEHFINDGQPIDQPSPGVPPCGGAGPMPPATPEAPAASVDSGGGGGTGVTPTAAPIAASTPPPPAPSCYGDYCSGRSPTKTNCSIGATVIASVKKGVGDDAALELMWSASCKTKWARIIAPAGWWAPGELAAEQSTGYTQSAGIGGHYKAKTTVLSPMIYSPKRCVAAWYIPGIGYSWNEVKTSCR
jgi:hypothetical protein